MKKIQIKPLFKQAWETTKAHFGFILGVMFIMIFIEFALGLVGESVGQGNVIGHAVLTLISVGVNIIVQIGVVTIILNLVEGRHATLSQFIGDYQLIVPYLLTNIVYVLMVFVGLLLFIVPGVIWSIKFGQWQFLVVEKRLGVMDALKESARITYGSKVDLFWLNMLVILVVIVSFIPLGLGLLLSMPFSAMVYGYVYKTLRDGASAKPAQQESSEEANNQIEGESMQPQI